jgi:hypothetical protein
MSVHYWMSLFFCSGSGRRLLEAVGAAKLLAEAFDAAGGIDEFLFAGEEGMAGAADINIDLGKRAAGDEGVAAGTVNGAGAVFGMDFFSHGQIPPDRACVKQKRSVTSAGPKLSESGTLAGGDGKGKRGIALGRIPH